MAIEHLLSLLQHSSGRGSRSTALQPLGWFLLIIGVILICILKYAPSLTWLEIAIVVLLIAGSAVYLYAYLYLVRTNPDATRSERFVLEKMQIQHSRIGDNEVGFSSIPSDSEPNTQIEAVSPKLAGGAQ